MFVIGRLEQLLFRVLCKIDRGTNKKIKRKRVDQSCKIKIELTMQKMAVVPSNGFYKKYSINYM
jgi:hypothetical protein